MRPLLPLTTPPPAILDQCNIYRVLVGDGRVVVRIQVHRQCDRRYGAPLLAFLGQSQYVRVSDAMHSTHSHRRRRSVSATAHPPVPRRRRWTAHGPFRALHLQGASAVRESAPAHRQSLQASVSAPMARVRRRGDRCEVMHGPFLCAASRPAAAYPLRAPLRMTARGAPRSVRPWAALRSFCAAQNAARSTIVECVQRVLADRAPAPAFSRRRAFRLDLPPPPAPLSFPPCPPFSPSAPPRLRSE